MDIHFYNTLSGKYELFTPIKENEVSLYVCGPTVYNYPHIGNARPVVIFDTLVKFLTYVGYKVTSVSNYTDVDDKIINKAIEEGKSEKEVSEFFISQYKDMRKGLNAAEPTYTPRVTETMPQIISFIQALIDKKAAYVVDGDVFFRVSSDPTYGELSKINVDDLKAGARIEENSKKESPLDFVLWKKTDVGIKWDTPWCLGRPGWHTECVVMINSIFKDNKGLIDIHGGGFDLKFPHHENEMAQSFIYNGNKLANYWIHNGFVTFGSEKMSKSLGNVVTASDAIKEFGGNVTRLFLLSSHYRAPLPFTDENIENAKNTYEKIENSYQKLGVLLDLENLDKSSGQPLYISSFLSALAVDINISNAMTELFAVIKEANLIIRQGIRDKQKALDIYKSLTDMLSILGLAIKVIDISNEDKKLYNEYIVAKQNKDFVKSDEIRKQLIERKIL